VRATPSAFGLLQVADAAALAAGAGGATEARAAAGWLGALAGAAAGVSGTSGGALPVDRCATAALDTNNDADIAKTNAAAARIQTSRTGGKAIPVACAVT
jgi:hypothetical protein